MRLASLLTSVSDEVLDTLAREHIRTDEKLSKPQLLNFLEAALCNYRFAHDYVTTRQPPTFALLTQLLDAPDHRLPHAGFRERVMAETTALADAIDRGEVLDRDRNFVLYRRALYEARRNDLDLNSSEAAILSVLRREIGMSQVDHFLIEHHSDLREFWQRDGSFDHELNALTSAGLVFVHEGEVVIAEEVAAPLWQTLGIDMPTDSARRLFGYLSNAELVDALDEAGARTSGTKEARLERLVLERIQPRVVLRSLGLPSLREICRATSLSITGNKDELVERIISQFAQRKDIQVEETPEPPVREERHLGEENFRILFNSFTHQEITDILRRFPALRQTGTKEVRVRTLWDAHLAETTLLSNLMNRDLEEILHRLGLRLGGSKSERIARIVTHFQMHRSVVNGASAASRATESPTSTTEEPPLPQYEIVQQLFSQKASNPQASLQPWLDELLNAGGLVRCYATEDPNPTKQLKNKLSQAASARGGFLVLLLIDEAAFMKAREALAERWLDNEEWSKNIACAALAYPSGSPRIQAIVENRPNPWTSRVRERLFPDVTVHAAPPALSHSSSCAACGGVLPPDAHFCPQCGARAT